MDIVAEAEQLVESEYCADCHLGCNMQDSCDGFKEEVARVVLEMQE